MKDIEKDVSLEDSRTGNDEEAWRNLQVYFRSPEYQQACNRLLDAQAANLRTEEIATDLLRMSNARQLLKSGNSDYLAPYMYNVEIANHPNGFAGRLCWDRRWEADVFPVYDLLYFLPDIIAEYGRVVKNDGIATYEAENRRELIEPDLMIPLPMVEAVCQKPVEELSCMTGEEAYDLMWPPEYFPSFSYIMAFGP